LGGFTAQISRFQHILPLSTAQINCSGSDLPFFRKPYLELALRLQLPIATREDALAEATWAAGVGVLTA
jgi:hypothetical protein